MPLDLVIALEIAKLIYTPFMENDAEMKHIETIQLQGNKSAYVLKGFEAHTLNLHEDMAEVEYIFSDKTGTLTQNELVFRTLSIVNNE